MGGMSKEPADGPAVAEGEKRMRLRYAGTCRLCGVELPARAEAIYERPTKTVRCVACESERVDSERTPSVVEPEVVPIDSGVAGASARREHERRKVMDEERLRAKWGRFGGIAVTLSGERQTTRVWQQGAIGEERLGARLDELVSDDLVALHDRRIPGSRANIDHLVVTRAGVWVVDPKRYIGQRPELRIEGGILRSRVEKLLVGGRDRTKLVDGVLKQMELVSGAAGGVEVSGALCFVEADWPLIGGAFTIRGVQVTWPKRLAKLLTEDSGDVDVKGVAGLLAERFPSA